MLPHLGTGKFDEQHRGEPASANIDVEGGDEPWEQHVPAPQRGTSRSAAARTDRRTSRRGPHRSDSTSPTPRSSQSEPDCRGRRSASGERPLREPERSSVNETARNPIVEGREALRWVAGQDTGGEETKQDDEASKGSDTDRHQHRGPSTICCRHMPLLCRAIPYPPIP